ncbi:putative prolyl aminopeptidase protein [Botrytis fragariae]|uniref:Putative prolyl aminopeptidase protein n=1 Tax=Botrytis fragariae TaxID=1964551 RepID=A0A8H6EJT7_9HELO|nr:putative prolyl aminopeptidase protein [Botrytis fragariae]KAF5874877.1 putative prolyl aminopeptidase protein [Botrytis fragariae]
MRPPSTPVFVLVPGASQSPAHYGLLMHFLLTRGHPVYSTILPSTGPGNGKNVTTGIPGSAAAYGLGKKYREVAGKKSSVLGRIYIASLLVKGGDGGTIVDALGGLLPPHITLDEPSGILNCADPGPPLHSDVKPLLFQNVIVTSTLCLSYAFWHSPCPRGSWNQEPSRGKIAFIRTLNDTSIPLQFQDMFMQNMGEEWIVRDMDTGHGPQLVQPERVCDVLIELAREFGGV